MKYCSISGNTSILNLLLKTLRSPLYLEGLKIRKFLLLLDLFFIRNKPIIKFIILYSFKRIMILKNLFSIIEKGNLNKKLHFILLLLDKH